MELKYHPKRKELKTNQLTAMQKQEFLHLKKLFLICYLSFQALFIFKFVIEMLC